MDIMRTHPMVIIGGVLQSNPFFVPPDEFLLELRERGAYRIKPAPTHAEVDRNQASTPELRDSIVLRRAMRDLLVLCTIPAAWIGREPDAIAKGVVDVLITALRIECAYLDAQG